MLVFFLVLGVLFYVRPITEDYPSEAAQFPQMAAAIVAIGSALLLLRNYLPGFLQSFVAESVSITSGASDIDEVAEEEGVDQERIDQVESDLSEATEPPESDGTDDRARTLGAKYGLRINDTVFMIVTAVLYLALGWAIGLLYVTPVFVAAYMLWFRMRWYLILLVAVLATLVIVGFIEFLILPFDRGELITLFEGGF